MNAILRGLFPPVAEVCVATADMRHGWLYPEEVAAISVAGAKRRGEFTAGRNAARRALGRFGANAEAIPTRARNGPRWPPGFVGSIRHCDGFCGAVVARRSDVLAVGFDAEEASPLNAEIIKLVCGADELSYHALLPDVGALDWPKLAFSAKEAFYKLDNPLTGEEFDFLDVSVRFSANHGYRGGAFEIAMREDLIARPGRQPWARGAWRRDDQRVYAGIALLNDRTYFVGPG